jgi:Putative Flp pilus-assembly TadE/G-like
MLTVNQEKERGQSIIVIAFVVVVLLALVAVVVDVGNAYAQRRVVQNAVDSAAMAGVTVLTEGLLNGDPNGQFFGATDNQVQQAIEDYAQINSLDPNDVVAWYIDDDGQRLRQVGTTPGSLVPRKITDPRPAIQHLLCPPDRLSDHDRQRPGPGLGDEGRLQRRQPVPDRSGRFDL